MDFSPAITQALKTLWWLIPVILFLGFLTFLRFLKSPRFKGLLGEIFVKVTAWFFLPAKIYCRFHNVTLPTPDGTTQIDHIFISRFGIFVVETKNMKGMIVGEKTEKQWLQQIASTSFPFQNPLHQNYKHVKALETLLGIRPQFIHSVVVFVGKSTFASAMPPEVTYRRDYIRYIKSFRRPVLSESRVKRARARIQSGRLTPSWKTHQQHVQQLEKRFKTCDANLETTETEQRICPNCGELMVLRTAKKGRNSGKQFWGCSAYPECRAVRNIR